VVRMAASGHVCSVCTKAFYGKQQCLKCCGPRGICFHLTCLQLSDSEYPYYTRNMGLPCTDVSSVLSHLVCRVNDGMLAKTRYASTSDVLKKVVSPERSLLPPVFKSTGSKELGLCSTMDHIKSHIDTVNKLCRKGDHM